MKKPNDIKKGLTWCIKGDYCKGCPYEDDCYVNLKNIPMIKEALAYIQQLEADNASKDERIQMLEAGMAQWEDVAASPGAVEDMARENHRLTQELEAVKRERDAAVKDLQSYTECTFCKHDGTEADMDPCKTCFHVGAGGFSKRNWQWRGVCSENTEVQEDERSKAD